MRERVISQALLMAELTTRLFDNTLTDSTVNSTIT